MWPDVDYGKVCADCKVRFIFFANRRTALVHLKVRFVQIARWDNFFLPTGELLVLLKARYVQIAR